MTTQPSVRRSVPLVRFQKTTPPGNPVEGTAVSATTNWSAPGLFRRFEAAGRPYLESRSKRLFDVAFSASALLILLPLFVLISAAIAVSSRGPVLFRQRRTGLGGDTFEILKFRSMYCQQGEGGVVVQAVRGDARVTPVGRFLRRTSFDELPQLINVLQGDMSIVGPRPHAVSHDDVFSRQIPNYRKRFDARPGITGLAQVRGSRGETPSPDAIAARAALDIEYIGSATIAVDVKIIALTVREVLLSDSAY